MGFLGRARWEQWKADQCMDGWLGGDALLLHVQGLALSASSWSLLFLLCFRWVVSRVHRYLKMLL